MAHWTDRVSARARLAEALQKEAKRTTEAGLLPADLKVIADEGRNAEAADADQKAELTEATAAVTLKRTSVDDAIKRETELRDRSPAVVHDLDEGGHTKEALFVARISFARFHIRELAGTAPAGETDPDHAVVAKLQRVEREDMPARMKALGDLCAVLLETGRETIVDAYTARGVSRSALETLKTDAGALAEGGRNIMTPAEATARESKAVLAQQKKWHAVRRLVRNAVRGSETLERLWASC